MDDERVLVECEDCKENLTQYDLIYMTDDGEVLCDNCVDAYLRDLKWDWLSNGEDWFD